MTAPTRASCTAAAITGPATTWVATSAPLMSSETPPVRTSRKGVVGFSVWRARVASISRRESAPAGAAGRSETGLMVVGMGSSCPGIGRADSQVSCRPVQSRRGVESPPWVSFADSWRRFGAGAYIARNRPLALLFGRFCSTWRLGWRRCFRRGATGTTKRSMGAAHQGPGGRLAIVVVLTDVSGVVLFLWRNRPFGRVCRPALGTGRARAARGGARGAFPGLDGPRSSHGVLKLVLYALHLTAFVLSPGFRDRRHGLRGTGRPLLGLRRF